MSDVSNFIQVLSSYGIQNTLLLILYLEFRLVSFCKDNCKNYRSKK